MYIQRQIESVIKKSLFKGKIIIIYGARQVGKTTLAQKIAQDSHIPFGYLNCDEIDVLSQFQKANNSLALRQMMGGNKLVIIDEAQRVLNIGLKLKLLIDNYPEIQLLVTGSSSLDLSNEISEPLTGRCDEFWLFPLSVKEIWQKSDKISRDRDLEKWLIYGSYPGVWCLNSNEEKSVKIKQLASNYLYKDVLKFNEVKNSETILKLLQALALQIGNEVSFNELATTVGVSKQTVASYIDLLEKVFVVFSLKPYSGNLRQALNKKRKIYFIDVGIRNAIINNQNSLAIRDDVGKLWENFIIAEKYKSQLGLGYKTNLYFWRTYEGQEVDLVEAKDGKLKGLEIKLKSKNKKQPKDWSLYKNSSWTIIDRENYWENIGKF
ncbi:MAG: ATP-binding protein [Candidatus Shapirobacteria bacterium]|nr:ATP-binding protein [Candidatus Shapirobacteria bacterium]